MTPTTALIENYFHSLADLGPNVIATKSPVDRCSLAEAFDWAVSRVKFTRDAGGKIIFIGNGGSAAIASHMAIDYSKNGGFPALAFNDAASLTCLANDLGYDQVFAHHVNTLGREEDMLIAISSSGQSKSILNAVAKAREKSMPVLTLSGFGDNNPLLLLGDVNLFVPSAAYGFVEITHLTLCHAILDIAMGWCPENSK
jgi:D-sedoheptulose 7-phosphate isomerase